MRVQRQPHTALFGEEKGSAMGTWMSGTRNRSDFDERLLRQWQQLARVNATLRANTDLPSILNHLTVAAPVISGFSSMVLYLQDSMSLDLVLATSTGLTQEDRDRLDIVHISQPQALGFLRPEMAINPGRSYRVRAAQHDLVASYTRRRQPQAPTRGDQWTPQDTLLLPLRHEREGQLIGLLALDQPADLRTVHENSLPSTIAIAEALGDTIMMLLENNQIFLIGDSTRQDLETGMTLMMRQFEQARRGNFSVEVPVSKTSVGVVSNLFNEMMERISTTLAGVRAASTLVNENASHVLRLANEVSSASQAQALYIDSVSSSIHEIAASIEDMAQVSDTAWIVAGNARDFSQAGRTSVEEAVDGMEGVRESAMQSSLKVKRLAESLQEIETIVQHVSDFTAKTNLLALNSSIEAGRAGEFGRGFSVIAQEIRTLALNSADAANQITERIRAVQGEATVVVTAISEGTERVVEQSDRIVDAGTALLAIDEVTEQIATLNESIRAVAREESARTTAIAAAMAEILQITDTTRDGVQQIASAMAQLVDFAGNLGIQIQQFTLRGDIEQPL